MQLCVETFLAVKKVRRKKNSAWAELLLQAHFHTTRHAPSSAVRHEPQASFTSGSFPQLSAAGQVEPEQVQKELLAFVVAPTAPDLSGEDSIRLCHTFCG